MMFNRFTRFRLNAICLSLFVGIALPASAQDTQTFTSKKVSSPIPLGQSLTNIGIKFNVVVIAPETLTRGIEVTPLSGELTLQPSF